ncbi:MAG: hypothetical protein MZV49_25580 [Rhodopseudomonas palustris]|nr:hypothetical protein [Rhodopseudomonas palustris]
MSLKSALDLGGYPVILSRYRRASAGLRTAPCTVEGIRRTSGAARAADLILGSLDPAAPEVRLPADLYPLAADLAS